MRKQRRRKRGNEGVKRRVKEGTDASMQSGKTDKKMRNRGQRNEAKEREEGVGTW